MYKSSVELERDRQRSSSSRYKTTHSARISWSQLTLKGFKMIVNAYFILFIRVFYSFPLIDVGFLHGDLIIQHHSLCQTINYQRLRLISEFIDILIMYYIVFIKIVKRYNKMKFIASSIQTKIWSETSFYCFFLMFCWWTRISINFFKLCLINLINDAVIEFYGLIDIHDTDFRCIYHAGDESSTTFKQFFVALVSGKHRVGLVSFESGLITIRQKFAALSQYYIHRCNIGF